MKEFLRQKNVPYTEKNVVDDDQAMDEVVRMGFSVTPVTVVDGEAVIGFNVKRLEELLGS